MIQTLADPFSLVIFVMNNELKHLVFNYPASSCFNDDIHLRVSLYGLSPRLHMIISKYHLICQSSELEGP